MDAGFTRRKLLTSAVTAAGVGLAGCNAGDGGTPSDARTDTATGTPSIPSAPAGKQPPVDFRKWIPSPEQLGADPYYFFAEDYTQLRPDDERFAEPIFDNVIDKDIFGTLGLGIDDVTYSIRVTDAIPTSGVLHGQFSQSTVVDRLRSLDYTAAEERAGYTIYQSPDRDQFVGVEDDVVALSRVNADDVALQLTMPDAESGGYPAQNDDLGAVLDAVGVGTLLFGGTNEPPAESDVDPLAGYFAGQVAHAYSDRVRGATTWSTVAYRFEDAAAAEAAEVEAFFFSDSFSEYENITLDRDGRKVVFQGEIDTEKLYL